MWMYWILDDAPAPPGSQSRSAAPCQPLPGIAQHRTWWRSPSIGAILVALRSICAASRSAGEVQVVTTLIKLASSASRSWLVASAAPGNGRRRREPLAPTPISARRSPARAPLMLVFAGRVRSRDGGRRQDPRSGADRPSGDAVGHGLHRPALFRQLHGRAAAAAVQRPRATRLRPFADAIAPPLGLGRRADHRRARPPSAPSARSTPACCSRARSRSNWRGPATCRARWRDGNARFARRGVADRSGRSRPCSSASTPAGSFVGALCLHHPDLDCRVADPLRAGARRLRSSSSSAGRDPAADRGRPASTQSATFYGAGLEASAWALALLARWRSGPPYLALARTAPAGRRRRVQPRLRNQPPELPREASQAHFARSQRPRDIARRLHARAARG